jgi:hypothetical protein
MPKEIDVSLFFLKRRSGLEPLNTKFKSKDYKYKTRRWASNKFVLGTVRLERKYG